ncbi:UNVERIFIED_CONTAM: hypothetical protein H355_010501 [Colinus virginianus]|nr:hypothetical protein H355_010501 [Colinus virginianus]
MMQLKQVKF